MTSETKTKPGAEQEASSSHTPADKAEARQAQVRRAQIEHRQRKANYVKHLEIEVAGIRDMITATQTKARLLLAENNAMRSRLFTEAVPRQPSILPSKEATAIELPEHLDMQPDNFDDITLSLELDAAMKLPVYQISSEATGSSYPPEPYLYLAEPLEQPDVPYYPFALLSPEQTQQAINFVLA